MTSREIVNRAITFKYPARMPVHGYRASDICEFPILRAQDFVPLVDGADEWGCVWTCTDIQNMGQVDVHPLEDIRKLDGYAFPDYTDDSRYTQVPAALESFERDGKYIVGGIFMVLFERMHALHGFENTLLDLYADQPAMEALADRIADVHVTLVNEVARRFPGRVDGWWVTEDWGSQQAAFISLDMWMDFFLPRYVRIFDAMHAAGCSVWVHSCGKVNELIEGYIQAGVDVVNLQQPRALGIDEISDRYRGRITFESVSDIQVSLPTGKRELILDDVKQLTAKWATPAGGFVFFDYGDDAALGISGTSAKREMYQAFSESSERIYGQPLPEWCE